MSLVFINNPMETFTPTSSGALATVIWECCRVAKQEGKYPYVITRTSPQARFPWPNTIALDYPEVPTNKIANKAMRAERKLTGWGHVRHRAYALRVEQALIKNDLTHLPLLLNNDPEMAVYLRRRFPKAFIMHWFHNQMGCDVRFRVLIGKSVNAILGVSDFTSQWVSDYYSTRDVKTLYNGVDLEHFSPVEYPASGKPVINFTGRTGIEKAPDLVLRAGLALVERTKNFSIQLIGSNHWDRFEMDEYQRRLLNYIDRLQAEGIEVRRPGHVGRNLLPQEFQRAQIHVVPSRWDEPFGLTSVEGMASGLAIVASDTGGTPEVVADAGFLFQRDSVEELTGHLYGLVTNANLRVEYQRKARLRAQSFPWKRTWNNLKELASL